MIIISFLLILAASVFFAERWGDTPEKIALRAVVIATFITWAIGYDSSFLTGQTRWAVFIVDLFLALVFVSLALFANRIWPLWTAALQNITVTAHVVNWLDGANHPWAYVASITVTSFVIPPVLAYGAYCHHRRTVNGIRVPHWSNF